MTGCEMLRDLEHSFHEAYNIIIDDITSTEK